MFSINDEQRLHSTGLRLRYGLGVVYPLDRAEIESDPLEQQRHHKKGAAVPVQLLVVRGNGSVGFEAGAGATLFVLADQPRQVYATGALGVRFVRRRDGLTLRITATPMTALGFDDTRLRLGVSIGKVRW